MDYEEDLGEMQEAAKAAGRQNLKQTKGAARLFGMVIESAKLTNRGKHFIIS